MVQCVAVWCSVVQCGAAWCIVLQCGIVCCSVLQCVAVCCSVKTPKHILCFQHVGCGAKKWCQKEKKETKSSGTHSMGQVNPRDTSTVLAEITLQHAATHCNALQRSATHCNTCCNTLRHTATHYTRCITLQHTWT